MSKKTNNQTASQLADYHFTDHRLSHRVFPLYMAVIIAFKQPSEMTNDIAEHWHFRKT